MDIFMKTYQFSLYELNRKYHKSSHQLLLKQRLPKQNTWDSKQKSELIESVLLGIHLPSFYFYETPNYQFIVEDGNQRLSVLLDFMNDQYTLDHLDFLKQINGKKFSDLDKEFQDAFEDFCLTVHVIESTTSNELRNAIVKRINQK